MEFGIIGLGKMGHNLALNAHEKGHKVYGFNRSIEPVDYMKEMGVWATSSIEEMLNQFEERKVIWLMVPAGKIVDVVIEEIKGYLRADDIIIDGGNSNYKDTVRRYNSLKELGINFVDVGTSGGLEGARNGACMMVGGDEEPVRFIEPVLKDICIENGYGYFGASGSGHYAKMIHNGIEYGMMQAIGEGFEILKEGPYDYNYEQLARVWSNGSVIRGWLMELTQKAFSEDSHLEGIRGVVGSSGEGLWTVEEAIRLGVPATVITDSLFARYRSHQEDTFSAKVVAGLRNQFGGHYVVKK